MLFINFVLMLVATSSESSKTSHPLSDEFIHEINAKATTWKAGRNFGKTESMKRIRNLMGSLPEPPNIRLPVKNPSELVVDIYTQEYFDARQEWPRCKSLKEVRDQGSCGSCWAIASVEVMTDRHCIHSGNEENFHYSTQDLLTCCRTCGFGCSGGYPSAAFLHWSSKGIVSGGIYGSNEGCKPYQIEPCAHHVISDRPNCTDNIETPECNRECQSNYEISYNADLKKGKNMYHIIGIDNIKKEIVKNGPVEASFTVYEDFLQYKSGIYQHKHGSKIGGHAIKILGFGIENGVEYWLCANSWNTDWGEKGFFKIKTRECCIECHVMAGLE